MHPTGVIAIVQAATTSVILHILKIASAIAFFIIPNIKWASAWPGKQAIGVAYKLGLTISWAIAREGVLRA